MKFMFNIQKIRIKCLARYITYFAFRMVIIVRLGLKFLSVVTSIAMLLILLGGALVTKNWFSRRVRRFLASV